MEIEKNDAVNAVAEEIERLRNTSEQYRRWWNEETSRSSALKGEAERLEAELAKAKTEIAALETELSETQTERAELAGETKGLRFAIRCQNDVTGVVLE